MRILPAALIAFSILPTSAAAEPAEIIDEITVVGTRVTRLDFNSASPVFTIESELILLDGSPTLTEYLNRSPQFVPASDRTANNPGEGRGEANLRGLGAKRTLVMIDGARLGPSGSDGAVDLNLLPANLIERVEVLTGGASAVYGSDAVSGIVNVILRRDVTGFEASGSYEVTSKGDGDIYDVSLSGGFGLPEERGTMNFFIGSTRRDEIPTADRSFSAVPISDDFFMGKLVPFGSGATPAGHFPIPAVVDGQFNRGGITFLPNGQPKAFGSEDEYNFYAEFNFLQVNLERDTVGFFSQYELSNQTTLNVDLIYSKRSIDQEIAPLPLSLGNTVINLDNPNLTPEASSLLALNYDPSGSGFYAGPFLYRTSQLGARASTFDRQDLRVSLGLTHSFENGWTARASYVHTDNDADQLLNNFVLEDRYLQSLLVNPVTGQCIDPSNGCVGGNYFGEGKLSAEAAAFIRAPVVKVENFMKQQTLQFTIDGDVGIGDRSVSIAAGLEWRRDEAGYQPDRSLVLENITGISLKADGGAIESSELFAEVVIPVLEPLLFEGAVRFSDYNTVGRVVTWKAGLSLAIADGLLLRGMSQRAVRAPNVVEQFEEVDIRLAQGAGFGLSSDACSASRDPVGNGLTDVCVAQGLPAEQVGVFESNPFYPTSISTGGNRNLSEEEADTLTLGFTWQPSFIEGLSLAIDYYNIEIDNAITDLNQTAVENLCFASADPANPFCSAVDRDGSGNISFVFTQPENIAMLTTKGIDLQAEYRLVTNRLGSFDFRLVANRTLENDIQLDPTLPALDCVGTFGIPCTFAADGSLPEQRANLSITWRRGPVSVQLSYRWIDALRNGARLLDDPFLASIPLAVEESESEDYVDLNLSWQPTEQVEVYFGIANLANTAPQLLGFNARQANTNPNLYDVLGRRYHARLTWRF